MNLKPKQLVSKLKKLGFTEYNRKHRKSGTHRRYSHKDGRKVTAVFFKGKDVSIGALSVMERQIGERIM